jgi:hypothetical protein
MRLTLPKTFWDDHYDRCADHAGERSEIRRNARTVEVELDAVALDDLASDAAYYANKGLDAIDRPRLVRSARATLRALQRVGA